MTTNESKFPKVNCQICGRSVSVIGMTAHQKTKLCQNAKLGIMPPDKKPTEVLKAYSDYNKVKRAKQIEEMGLDELRKLENAKKRAQRAAAKKKDAQTTPELEPEPEPEEQKPVKVKQPKRNQNKIPKNFVVSEDAQTTPEPEPNLLWQEPMCNNQVLVDLINRCYKPVEDLIKRKK